MKVCSKCKKELPLSNYYNSRYSHCIACHNMMQREWYKKNKEHHNEKSRNHYQSNKEVYKNRNENWRKNKIEAERASDKIKKGLKSGKIIRPMLCFECGIEEKLEAHHDDYSRPLEVRWLCRSCHIIYHRRKDACK